MKAISVRQPFAWALFHGKPVENRDWRHSHRGPLLIHASKTFDTEGYWWIHDMFPDLFRQMPPSYVFMTSLSGAFVGQGNMVDCVKQYPSPWFFGPWGHVYENPVEFKKPIPWRGMPGIFDVPDSIIEEAMK